MALLLRPVTFVGGKGGVGKTTISAAAAVASADSGQRTLLVSTDPAHSAGDILEARLRPEPAVVTSNLDAMELDAQVEADRYIAEVKERVREVTSPAMLIEVEREIDIARATPGAHEAALFDRLADLMTLAGAQYDRVIVDTAPTGHTLRLLGLPELMEAWVDGLVSRRRKLNSLGRMWRRVSTGKRSPGGAPEDGGIDPADPVLQALERRQRRFRVAREIVTDPDRAVFVFIVTPERLPILETARAVESLERYRIPVGGVIVNRVLPTGVEGAFLARRRQREAGYLEEIDRAFAGYPRSRIELREEDVAGLPALREIGQELQA